MFHTGVNYTNWNIMGLENPPTSGLTRGFGGTQQVVLDNIRSSVRLFADDCVLYRNIHSLQDCLIHCGAVYIEKVFYPCLQFENYQVIT